MENPEPVSTPAPRARTYPGPAHRMLSSTARGPLEAGLRAHLEHLSHTPDPVARRPTANDANSVRTAWPPRHRPIERPPYATPETTGEEDEPPYLALSRTTERVLRMLLEGDLARLRAESVAEALGISCTTLRRRLRGDHTSYQFLLDRARQYRCESRLEERWLPGKCLADELGYLEVNSFYRAFRRWTGVSYSEYRQRYH